MKPIKINIPDPSRAAGQIVIDAIREAGIDPARAATVPMIRELVGKWGRDEITRDQFISLLRKLLLLNPSLKAR